MDTDKELREYIGISLFGPKYYDYILTPVTEPRGKYPSDRAIAELDRVMQFILADRHRHIALAQLAELANTRDNWHGTDDKEFADLMNERITQIEKSMESKEVA